MVLSFWFTTTACNEHGNLEGDKKAISV